MQIVSIILWATLGLGILFSPKTEVNKIIFGATWAVLMMNLVAQAINGG